MNTQRFPAEDPPPPPTATRALQTVALQKFTRRPFMWVHLPYTIRLISRCLRDSRTPALNKLLFLAIIGFLLALVVLPEFGADVAALALPVAGELFDVVGIPFEGVVDWTFVIMVLPLLLNFFPADVRAYHVWELKGQPMTIEGAPAKRLPPPAPPTT